MISMRLDSVRVKEVPDYMLAPLKVDEIQAYVDDLMRRMALMALP